MANEFLVKRVAAANFVVLASAATQSLPSGVYIPGGAIVTGVTMINTAPITIANASGSIDLRVKNATAASSQALIITAAIKNAAGAETIPYIATLSNTKGVYLPVGGELVLSVQATSGSSVHTYAPDIYVGYLYA